MRQVLAASLPVLLIVSLLLLGACSTHKKVPVPQLLTPVIDANTDQLITEVNRLASINSIHGKFDIQFQDTSFAAAGVADFYRSADANITVQRPGKVYLVIQALFVDIAAMASDGEHFSVALLKGDEKYRRFVKGTNSANYGELKTNGSMRQSEKAKIAEGETVSALSNLRPQHLTDALLIRPIAPASQSGLLYSQSEFYEEEPDQRPQAKKSARIVRGSYLLEELSPTASGEAHLRRRFWFDRVGAIRLARLQSFDEYGLLETDVTYSQDRTLGEGPAAQSSPSHIELTRPKDEYKLSLTYQPSTPVIINKVWEPEVFVLQNKWGLPEVDLDTHKDTRAKTSP